MAAVEVRWLQYARWDSVNYKPGDTGTIDDSDYDRLRRANYVVLASEPVPPPTYPDPLPQYLLQDTTANSELDVAMAAVLDRSTGVFRSGVTASTEAIAEPMIEDAIDAEVDRADATYAPITAYPTVLPRGYTVLSDTASGGWVFGNTAGLDLPNSGLTDTSVLPPLGDSSIKMAVKGDDSFPYAQKDMSAFDLTGRGVIVWIMVVGVLARISDLSAFIGNAAMNSYFRFRVQAVGSAGKGTLDPNVWIPVKLTWANASTVGTPNRAALTSVRVVTDSAGTNAVPSPYVLHFGGIATFPEPTRYANGVVTLSFDDSFDSTWTYARPKMSAVGFPGLLFPIIDLLDTAGRLTLAQVKFLHDVQGWEVGGHATSNATHVPLTGMTQAARRAELALQAKWLQDNGFSGRSHAWPVGSHDTASTADLARYFRSSRTNFPMHNPVEPLQPHRIQAFVTNNFASTLLADAKAYIDRVAADKSWGQILFHELITAGPTANNQWTVADFNELIDYIVSKGVAVRTTTQVLDGV